MIMNYVMSLHKVKSTLKIIDIQFGCIGFFPYAEIKKKLYLQQQLQVVYVYCLYKASILYVHVCKRIVFCSSISFLIFISDLM